MNQVPINIHFLKLFFVGLLGFYSCSCQYVRAPFIEANTDPDLKEVRLGESNYYLLLPDSFQLSEARGKEGQLGYSLRPKDASSTMFGFIEIRAGHPIKGDATSNTKRIGFATSNLLDRRVTWTIDQTETGYFNAYTNEEGDLNARASSKNREEIDWLISIIATLKKK